MACPSRTAQRRPRPCQRNRASVTIQACLLSMSLSPLAYASKCARRGGLIPSGDVLPDSDGPKVHGLERLRLAHLRPVLANVLPPTLNMFLLPLKFFMLTSIRCRHWPFRLSIWDTKWDIARYVLTQNVIRLQ